MPFLDVTDVLLDPDFMDTTLVCHRQIQTTDSDNFATNTVQDIPFSGVVTVDRALGRRAEHQRCDSDCDAISLNTGADG